MDRLPSELLHNIFLQVPFEERLECTLVCRAWYTLLSKRSLLYDVHIQKDEIYSNFIDMLQCCPHRRTQVKILTLQVSTEFDKRRLCNLLPNLRQFQHWKPSFRGQTNSYHIQPVQLQNPYSKLEVIKDCGECELARQWLKFGFCTRLRHLELTLWVIDNPREEVFYHLSSAPNLKKLNLDCCQIGTEDVEMIHKNVPVLESLELRKVTLVACEPPRDIIPANSLTKFRMGIYNIKDYPNYLDWYRYMAMKYTSLKSLQCTNREHYDIDPSEMMEVYQDGILPIYRNNANRLKYFHAVNVPTELNLFQRMDAYGLRVTQFDIVNNGSRFIFEQLAQSKQAAYTETIELYRTDIVSPVMIQNFVSLTSLKIDNSSKPIDNLTDLLNALPPSLASLVADIPYVTIDALPTLLNNIEYLSFRCTTLMPELGEAISHCFPKLKHLSLYGRVYDDFTINLPEHHFETLEFKIHYAQEDPYAFSITNERYLQPQYIPDKYFEKKSGPITKEDLEGRVIISLNYATAKFLRCHNLYMGSG